MNCTENKLLLHNYYMICWSPGTKRFIFFQSYRTEGKYFPETEPLNQTDEKILLHLQLPWPFCPTWGLLLHIFFHWNWSFHNQCLGNRDGRTNHPTRCNLHPSLLGTVVGEWLMILTRRHGSLWNYRLLIERENFCHDQAVQGPYN